LNQGHRYWLAGRGQKGGSGALNERRLGEKNGKATKVSKGWAIIRGEKNFEKNGKGKWKSQKHNWRKEKEKWEGRPCVSLKDFSTKKADHPVQEGRNQCG